MRIVGYSDRLSVAPGETIRFMVSCHEPAYEARLVQLIHGDPSPRGPGFKELEIASPIDGRYPGRIQSIAAGSFIRVDHHPELNLTSGFTIGAWIKPTLPGRGAQGILAKFDRAAQRGYSLELNEAGALFLRVGNGEKTSAFETDAPLRTGNWCFVLASFDPIARSVTLLQRSLDLWPIDPANATVVSNSGDACSAANETPLVIGAGAIGVDGGPIGCFNGKIDNPSIIGRAATHGEASEIAVRSVPEMPRDAMVARWNFSCGMASSSVHDEGPHECHGRAINLPTRAVTGHLWSGDHHDPAGSPAEYTAIHFHEDDLEDALWDADFELAVPEDLKSGVYAIRLRAGEFEDYLPFVVRPPRGRATTKIVYLISTFTYLAYANEHMPVEPAELFPIS